MENYSTWVMNPLLDKLTKLKNHPKVTEDFFQLIDGLQLDLVNLKKDPLDEFAGRRTTDDQVKEWMKQAREMLHDIEDWIDLNPEVNLGESEKEEIEYFKIEIEQARERCTRYDLLTKAPTADQDRAGFAPSEATIDPQLLLEEKPCLVGVEGPINELTSKDEKVLKVVSVFGIEGLGKTTLAKQIYAEREWQEQFESRAFVTVGRRPCIRAILVGILRQVKRSINTHRAGSGRGSDLDVQQVITELRGYLSRKRYFIVLDGIWSTWVWNIINCALPDMNLGSRVLTTTCLGNVANSCSAHQSDAVYLMEPLSQTYTGILLLNCRLPIGVEVSGNLLKMCGGMPLAIIVGAGLLATKSPGLPEPEILQKHHILSTLEQYSTPEGMRSILHMSYADLPAAVRCCFLYLGGFPEDYTIRKDRLIRLWIAEGFISRRDEEIVDEGRYEENLWWTGERYFNELISRRLIQPVFNNYDDDQAVGCRVHGMILDFVRSLSRELNFGTRAAELSSDPFPCERIRRFSLDCNNEGEAHILVSRTLQLSSMRSLGVFGDVEEMLDPLSTSVSEDDEEMCVDSVRTVSVVDEGMLDLPFAVSEDDEEMFLHSAPIVSVGLLSGFKLIRVLDLEDTKNFKYHHLEGIGGLTLLSYLGLGGTCIYQLPEEIGRLEQLETLDLRRNGRCILPPSVGRLPKLVHLLVDIAATEIEKILGMQELEEVSNIHVHSSRSLNWVAELVGRCNRLWMLGLTLEGPYTRGTFAESFMSFLQEIVKSNALRFLSLSCPFDNAESFAFLADSWEKATALQESFDLRRFDLSISAGKLKSVPPNMASLASLTHLRIEISEVGMDGIGILGCLRNLVLLNLALERPPQGGCCIIEKGLFPCLRVLSFGCRFGGIGLKFKEGAMPQLRRLGLDFSPGEHLDIGIKHLACLTRVHATISCFASVLSEAEAAETHIREQVSENTNEPRLEVSRLGEPQMRNDQG